ncbi:alpha/beta hydrolase [Zeaxanthinibacter sp. PT1]|uniref:alpha/beta hydrolase n=1 Tax=Zeaxanthinibacter TaxID=561554 RepID=UPI00234A6030|nr:alpha/beta hydrolase [Zeaxanthinibacter sp. PT1]MDC6350286.1 alpha/beta hydrolase [Zeaxanthinibacter sp. PT1]
MSYRKLAVFCTTILSLVFFSCNSSFEEIGGIEKDRSDSPERPPLEKATLMNISYGSHPLQKYDIYLPFNRNAEKTKVIILVHGGGWIEGDKESMTPFIELIKEHHPDHAIVNMNYVLAEIGPSFVPAFPNQFQDIGRVINQIIEAKSEYQILPQFGMIGTSAGAHLSLMYDFVYDTEDQVKFVVDIVGPTDFTDPFYTEDPNFNLALSVFVDESQYPQGTNYAEAVSPVYNVRSSSSPVALFYGDEDPLVPLSNGIVLDEVLTDFGIEHNLTVYQGGHGDDWSTDDLEDIQEQINQFIDLHLPVN